MLVPSVKYNCYNGNWETTKYYEQWITKTVTINIVVCDIPFWITCLGTDVTKWESCELGYDVNDDGECNKEAPQQEIKVRYSSIILSSSVKLI